MDNKSIKLCFVLLLIFLPTVNAINSLQIIITPAEEDSTINRISVLSDNRYYMGLGTGAILQPTEYKVEILDKNGKVISSEVLDAGYIIVFNYDNSMSTVNLYYKENLVLTYPLNFCNNNGVCEPCDGENCSISENVLTCNDCSSGSKDKFCDLIRDDICDPDCDGIDADCEECKKITCAYNDTPFVVEQKLCVKDLSGQICKASETCTKEFVYSDDAGSLCCKGDCVEKIKEKEEIVEPIEETKPEIKEIKKKPGIIESLNIKLLVVLVVIVTILLILLKLSLKKATRK